MDRVRIMVVDDDRRMRRLLARFLFREGYEVEEAPDGSVAAEVLAARPMDVVLTDVRMPGMDGLELMESIRDHSPETAVILMTAFGTEDSRAEALEEGADGYLSKPFQIEDVVTIIRRLLERRRERA